jgi:hypothetical protein
VALGDPFLGAQQAERLGHAVQGANPHISYAAGRKSLPMA